MKLYQLTVTYTAYVLAENETAAEHLVGEVVSTEPEPEVWAGLVHSHHRMDGGWDGECLVYGADGDVQLGEVWPTKESEEEAGRAAENAARQLTLGEAL